MTFFFNVMLSPYSTSLVFDAVLHESLETTTVKDSELILLTSHITMGKSIYAENGHVRDEKQGLLYNPWVSLTKY